MDYNSRILARNYAKAFCTTSLLRADLTSYEQLLVLYQDLSSNKALTAMMSSPLFDAYTKKQYCLWLLKRYELDSLLLALVELLIAHERIALLALVVGMSLQLYEDYHHLEYFEISSAADLSNDERVSIERYLSSALHKKIISKTTLDPVGLLAGIKITSMTHCLDYSLAKKLRSVRHMLLSQGITWK